MRTDVALLVLAFASAGLPLFAQDGREAFVDNSCDRCHSIASADIEATVKSERMRGPDLSNIGKTREADWLARYLEKEADIDGKPHRSSFKGSDEELQAIAAWLAGLEDSS